MLDMRMPGMGGEAMVRLLKADPDTAAVRMVGYTAHALPDEIASVREAGVYDVLIKPVLMHDMKRVFGRPC